MQRLELLDLKKHSARCWPEIPSISVRKRTGRDLNPLNLSVVIHVLRTGSRVCTSVCGGL